MPTHFRWPAFIAFIVLLSPCHAIDGSGTIVSQGITRNFLYHAPGDSVPEGLPLVIVFHAQGETADAIKAYSGFDAVADANNFLVVYPNATNIAGSFQWNAYADEVSGHGGIGDLEATSDVVFIDDLVDHICMEHAIDSRRIYATGFSNGAYMAYLLAIQRPMLFAAVAPVSGSLWGDQQYMQQYFSASFSSIAVMHVHGHLDATVQYPDPGNDPFAYIWPLSAFGMGNCNGFMYTAEELGAEVRELTFCNGNDPSPEKVKLIDLVNGGHQWPDPAIYDAPQQMWTFFDQVWREALFICQLTGVTEMEDQGSRTILHPNPTDGVLRTSIAVAPGTRVLVRDVNSTLVMELPLFNGMLDATSLSSGVYTIEMIDTTGRRSVARFLRE